MLRKVHVYANQHELINQEGDEEFWEDLQSRRRRARAPLLRSGALCEDPRRAEHPNGGGNGIKFSLLLIAYNLPMLNSNFIIIGALIGAAGSVAYLIDTVKGKVRPNRVSFLLWSIAPLIAFFAQIRQGVGFEALMTFSTGFMPLTVFIASFVNKQAEWKLTRFDLLCGILSLMGLAL